MNFSYHTIFNLLVFVYVSSAIGYFLFFTTQKKKFGSLGFVLAFSGWILHTGLVVYRCLVFKSFAVSGLYESLSFFAWVIVLVYLISEFRHKQHIDGVFVLPLAVSLAAYASVINSDIKPLPAVLRSPWMAVHVTLCFLSYACFTLAFCFAVMYIWQEKELKSRKVDVFFFRLPALEFLDRLGYRAIVFGFVFLSLGIVSGSIWAQKAWGTFWSWDPKETFSLILWLIYLVYLHGRLMAFWRGKKSARLAIIGFAIMIFTYLGVSFLLPGLHSYISK
jgi:cytochrome c-type biogenesis protein CcsB